MKQQLMPLQQPLAQCNVPPQRLSLRSPPQPCVVSRVATVEEIHIEPSAGEEIPLDVCACIEEKIENNIEPERVTLESQRASTGLGDPGQQRISS